MEDRNKLKKEINYESDLLSKSLMINILLAIAVVVLAILFAYQAFSGGSKTTTQLSAPTHVNSSITNTTSTPSISYAYVANHTNIPLNSSELSAINNAPLSYYETAAEKLLNGTLTNRITLQSGPQGNVMTINGKPTVIYLGATSCIYCAENRWAMALALAKFGKFNSLYTGYSAMGDDHIPTLFWLPANITTTSGMSYGNNYSSNYINFISADYESPLSGSFELPSSFSYFISKAPNATYANALIFMNDSKQFQGTPFTFWGTTFVAGADGVVFGNETPTSAANITIAYLTHGQILNQLSKFNDQFAWSEYAAADVYIAYTCPSISNNAPVCKLPGIQKLESIVG